MENRQLIHQANAITESRQSLTARQKNAIYLLISKLSPSDPQDKVYTFSLKEMEKAMGVEINHAHLKEMTEELVKKAIHINGGVKGYLSFNIFLSAKYQSGDAVVTFELSKEIRKFFFFLCKNFTTYQLATALTLKSKFAKHIYEMLSQYKDTGCLKITINELKLRLGLIDPSTGVEKLVNMNRFKERVLEIAKTQINNNPTSDLFITYEAHKTGKKYTHVTFKILHKKSKERAVEDYEKKNFNRLKKEFKLSDWQAKKIVQEVPSDEIRKVLYDVSLQKSTLRNVAGYTAKVFSEKYNLGFFQRKPTRS